MVELSPLAPLAGIIGILFGAGMTYLYLGRVNKKRIEEALEYMEKNPSKFYTLESEDVDRSKKEGETPKEESNKTPAPSLLPKEEVEGAPENGEEEEVKNEDNNNS